MASALGDGGGDGNTERAAGGDGSLAGGGVTGGEGPLLPWGLGSQLSPCVCTSLKLDRDWGWGACKVPAELVVQRGESRGPAAQSPPCPGGDP